MSKVKPLKIRSDITEFSAAMEFEMSENDDERGDSWKEEDLDFMIGRIHEEVREINRESDNLDFDEMDKKQLASVMREAADAGNFNMMIWCQCRDQLKSRP